MAGNPLASLPGLPQRPSLARSAASETRLTQPGIEVVRSRKLNPAPTAAFRLMPHPRPRTDMGRVHAIHARETRRGSPGEFPRICGSVKKPNVMELLTLHDHVMMRDASAIGYRRRDDEIGETAQRPRFHRVILNVIDDFVGTVWIFHPFYIGQRQKLRFF